MSTTFLKPAEQRRQFVTEAKAALADMQQTGLGHDAADVHDYLRNRINVPDTPRPIAKPWRK